MRKSQIYIHPFKYSSQFFLWGQESPVLQLFPTEKKSSRQSGSEKNQRERSGISV